MLRRVLVIALNTYRESVRARILLGLAGVAFAISLYSIVLGAFTLHDAARVVSDVGAASMSLFSIAVAVVIAATSLHRELEQKTIFPILARPIRRGEYLVGKYFGTLLTLGVFIMADAGLILINGAALSGRSILLVVLPSAATIVAVVAIVVKYAQTLTFAFMPWAAVFLLVGVALAGAAPEERRLVLNASLLTFLEVAIVTAVATFFASFSTPFLSALLTIGLWLVGRS